jgi:hypothetical protein
LAADAAISAYAAAIRSDGADAAASAADVNAAVDASTYAAYAAAERADLAGYVADMAAQAATTSAAESHAAYAAISRDADILTSLDEPRLTFHRGLWEPAQMPEWLMGGYANLTASWAVDPATWAFWARWYQGMLDGKPLDWELQRAVALIEDEVWQAGPEAVAERIRDIEAAFIVEKLPQAEEMVFDAETGTFEIHPIEISDERLIATTFQQVDFALRTALQSNCGLNTNSTASLYIRQTLDNCRDDPNAIEQNLEIAASDIGTGLASGTYYEDSRLTALQAVLERAVLDMRANHSVVAEAWKKRTAFVLRSLKAEQKRFVLESTMAVAPVLGNRLATGEVLDARTAASSDAGEVQVTALGRWLNRFARMRLIARSAEVIRRINENPAYLGARILQVLKDIWAFIGGLF